MLTWAIAPTASAQRGHMRVDVLGGTQPDTGLVVLERAERSDYVDLDALVWSGIRPTGGYGEVRPDMDGDPDVEVVVLSVRARAPEGLGEARLGRFVLSTGAVRPVHVDGAHVVVRVPDGTTFEPFAGVPVETASGPRRYAWLAGGRVSHAFGDVATLGASFYSRRDDGAASDREIGVDLAIAPAAWLDVAGAASLDLIDVGLADVNVSAAARVAPLRIEAFLRRRSPARILPASSIFTVLGDVPATNVGSTVRWDAAPRLDVWATGAMFVSSEDVGWQGSLKAALALDDEAAGSVICELRRQDYLDAAFVGARVAVWAPVIDDVLDLAGEIELVRPDEPRQRGSVWPWVRLSSTLRPIDELAIAAAIEGGASPTAQSELRVLVRATLATEEP